MNAMKEWLSETIRNELGKALLLKSGEVSNVQTPEATCEDDGSNLRMRCPVRGIVQIIKWEKDEEPTHAVISDSATHLRATIASAAAQKFNTKDGKRVTEHTLGNVIRLLDSEIVATHLGPRAQRLTMLVKDFEVLWSDRSQAHGQPRPIEAIQENILLLDKLSLLRAWENTTKHQNLQWESVRSSQNAFLSLWNERLSATDTQFPSNSQQLFSQVPVSSIKEKSAQHGTETHSPKQQDKRKDFVQSNGFPSKRNSSNDGSNTTRNRSSPRSNTGKRRKLLGLKLADGEVAGFEKQLEAKKPKNQTDRLMGILYTNRAVSSRMNGPSVASGAAATLPAVDAHNDTQAVGLDSTEIGSKSPRRVEGVNGRLEETTATSITTCETREVEHSIPQRSPKQLSDRSPTPKQDCCNEHSLHHLRRRDVQIPKDQQALLDREDSWLPAEPGQRGPVSNVPIVTLQAMTRLVEQQGDKEVKKQEDMPLSSVEETYMKQMLHQSNVSSSGHAQASDQDSESDVPIPSAEWPSSPIQTTNNQLPSDSNTGSDEDIHGQEQEFPATSKGTLSPVRNEENNLRTKSISQEYPSAQALPVQPKSRSSSKASQAKATEPSNPDTTDDESCQYVCELPGCSQAFNRRSGLSYHLLHHHNLTPASKGSKRMLTSTASTTQGDRPDTLSQNQPPEPTFGFSRQKPQNSQRKSSRTLEASSSQLSDSKPKKTEPRKEIIDLTQLSDGNDSYSDSAKEQSDQGERDLKNNPPVLLPDSGSNHLEQEQVSHTGDIAQSYQEQSEVNYSSSKLQTSHQEPTQVEARSSSPESILETAVPQALCEPKTPAEETSLQQIPSTVPLLEDSSHLKTSQYNFECDRGKLQDNFTTTDVDTEQLNGNVRNVEKGLIDQSANFDETTSLGKSMPSTKIIVSKSWGVSTNDTSIKLDRKRKFPEPAIPSSNTWKRRRHQRRPLGLDFSQGTADMRDPSIMARKYREEFLASRKNSLSESYDSPSRMSSVNGTPDRKLDLRANPILSLTSKDQPDFTLESTGVQEFQHLPEKKHANKALLSAHEEYTVAADTTAKAPERPRSETRETDLDAVSQKLQVFSSAQESQNITKATYEPTVGGVQAQSLTELMTPALSITDGEPVQSFEPFFGMQASRSPLPSSSIFEQFRTTYPEYAGTFSHFVGICKKIKSLHEADRMEHRALWDDFIVRHNTEYPQYLRRCAEAVEDCLPYEKYYRCEIEEPIYKNHIVTPTSLSQILASESSPYTSGSLTRSETPLHSKADIGPPLQQKPNQAEVRIKETPLQQRKESPDAVFQRLEERRRRRSHLNSPMVGGATTASFQKQEASPPPVERRLDVKNEQAAETINLTEDDVLVPESSPCGTVESPTLSPKKSSRTLPWVSSGDTITPTRRDPLSKVNSMIAPKIKHNDLKSPVNSSRATNSAPSKLCNVTLKPGMRDTSLPRTSSLCRSKRAIESSSKKRIEVQRSTPIIEMQLVESRGIDDWWKDENSPFNIFRRKYMAITPGKGNSYAQDHEREMGNRRQRDGR